MPFGLLLSAMVTMISGFIYYVQKISFYSTFEPHWEKTSFLNSQISEDTDQLVCQFSLTGANKISSVESLVSKEAS